MKNVGDKIYDLRKKKGLSQEQLGFEINVSRQTISKWESNAMLPTMENIRALCEYFNVPSEYFLGESTVATIDSVMPTVCAAPTSITDISVTSQNIKYRALFIFGIIISLVILIVSIIVCCIAISIASIPPLGKEEVHVIQADVVAIICGILALAALITIITLVAVKIKTKNH